MSAPPGARGAPITSKADLVAYMAEGSKPKADWRIGTEHEKFAFTVEDLRPLPHGGPRGIEQIFKGLIDRFGWTAHSEADKIIALTKGQCNITLEPGGQFELSGAPLVDLHETCSEVHVHLAEVRAVCEPLNVKMMGMGLQPKWARADIPMMPKGRYKIMSAYMPKKGKLGLDMMLRTCTVQTNLDFSSEADMVKKFRVSLALQPIATALFANSPFTEGKPNGFLSFRSHIWTDTDPDRCGMLDFVFEEGMGFERYVDHVLGVPMYFVYRDGKYLDASGLSFKDFMVGSLAAAPGQLPTTSDWADHLSTLFPEVRLKKFLEMRGADAGRWQALCALPALWVGLLYDQGALDAAWDLVKAWSMQSRNLLRDEVPRLGLAAKVEGRSARDIAQEVVEIAAAGLKARACVNGEGLDERIHLERLQQILKNGKTPAEEKLETYHGRWGGSVDPIFSEYAY